MDEYISREMAVKKLQMQLLNLEADQDKGEYSELCENRGARDALDEAIYAIRTIKAADVQPVVHAKWEISSDGYYPYCSRCFGRPNGELTKYCPDCGARMDLKDGDAE